MLIGSEFSGKKRGMSKHLCKTHEIAPTLIQPNRRRVPSDCSLSVQLLRGDLPMKKGLQQLTTFSHTIALQMTCCLGQME